jgi:hypothetical protein
MSAILNLLLAGAAKVKDQYFNLVMLLLGTTTTSGTTNNTFLDSSSNNYSITRNGSATQGTFTPFSQTGWSNYYNGSSTFTPPAGLQTAFAGWGGRTRTWECWIYRDSTTSYNFQSAYGAVAANGRWYININASNKLVFAWTISTSTQTEVASVSSVPAGWVHLSVTVNSTTASSTIIYLGINGVVETFTGNDLSTQTSTYGWNDIFGNAIYLPAIFTGYATGLRWSSNLRYTSNYTVPTGPFINDANTLFLFGQQNRFSDQSSNAYTVAVAAGTPSVQTFFPFAPTSDYSTSLVGGSGYFSSATSDYLTIANDVPLQFGTGSFTINCWVYRSVAGVIHSIAGKGASGVGWTFQINASNQLVFVDTGTSLISSTTIPAGVWTYVSVTRDVSNVLTLYINAVSVTTTTSTTNFNQTNTLVIGADRTSTNFFNGFIAGFEYIKGSAITPSIPTLPPTTDGSPSLLLNFTNFGVYDATSRNDFITVGTAQSSTANSYFGGTSVYFDGGSFLTYLYRTPFDTDISQLSSFTVECWIYTVGTVPTGGQAIIGTRGTSSAGFEFRVNATTNTLSFYNTGGSTLTTTASITPGTWYYIAAVKNAGTITMYINGVDAGGSGTLPAATASGLPLYIGGGNRIYSYLQGYIDELRITRNVARTVTTVPIAPFPTQ